MISPHIGVGDLKIFNNNKYANFFFGRDMEYSKQKEKKKKERGIYLLKFRGFNSIIDVWTSLLTKEKRKREAKKKRKHKKKKENVKKKKRENSMLKFLQ